LLIGHRRWLYREDFVDEFIETSRGSVGRAVMAFCDWTAVTAALDAGRLGCSGSEERVLRIAASLIEGIPVDLGEALSGLDEATIVLVAQAVVHANGHRQAVVTLAGAVRW
jgi:hypothetical protein